MSYTIRFLNDKDFEQLPAKDIESKIGVAYPDTGEAFVRSSGSNVVDVFTAIHELEHLKGNDLDEHFDEENKCYYKGFGDTLSQFFQASIPGTKAFQQWAIAPLAGAAGTAIGGPLLGSAAYQGVNSYKDSQQPALSIPQRNSEYNFAMPSGSSAPFTSQAIGGGGGSSMGGVGGNSVKNLSQQPQFSQQSYGNYSGRDPLDMFRMYNQNDAGTPIGGAA